MSPAIERRDDPPRFTYGDYVRWEGDERWELIDGEAYCMSPAPSRAHQRILFELGRQIGNALAGKKCEANVAPFDVRLPERDENDEEIETVVQPDLLVVCDPSKLDAKGARGAPDFVIEILSPATASRDRVHKSALYEKHGVREYWIVDPDGRWVEVRRLGADGRWEPAERFSEEDSLECAAVPGLRVDLKPAFDF